MQELLFLAFGGGGPVEVVWEVARGRMLLASELCEAARAEAHYLLVLVLEGVSVDREVVRVITQLGERSRCNKSLFSWVGFETDEVTYERPPRAVGTSRWNYWKLTKLDNVICSPHIGATTREAQGRVGAEVAEKLIEFAKTL